MKKCTKCNTIKEDICFYKDRSREDLLQYRCKDCTKKYAENNKIRITKYKKEYTKNNKEKISKDRKIYYSNKNNKKHKKDYDKEYYELNRDKILERMKNNNEHIAFYVRNKLSNDLNFKLATYLRNRTRGAIKNNQKSGSAVRDMGCSIDFLKRYIEYQFIHGMSWDNWGKTDGCWSIDHIKPLSRFNLSDRSEFLEATHYTNLRPMWHIDNIKKGNKTEDYTSPGVFVKPA